MSILRRVAVNLSALGSLLGTMVVLSPAAHADCILIGHVDLQKSLADRNGEAHQGARVQNRVRHELGAQEDDLVGDVTEIPPLALLVQEAARRRRRSRLRR